MYKGFKLTKELEEVGFSRAQAERQIQVIAEFTEGELATKHDLKTTEMVLKQEMQLLESRLIIKLGTFLIIGFTAMATLMKLWIH